jgi:hypothetical protein
MFHLRLAKINEELKAYENDYERITSEMRSKIDELSRNNAILWEVAYEGLPRGENFISLVAKKLKISHTRARELCDQLNKNDSHVS